MATYERIKLSASSKGKPINITASSSPGTTIHTAVSGTTNWDEIWLWVRMTSSGLTGNWPGDIPRDLVRIEFGGTTDPDDIIMVTPDYYRTMPLLIVPGLILQNSLVVKAYKKVTGPSAPSIGIEGFVNRITV